MKSKKGVSLSFETVVVGLLIIIALAVIIIFFYKYGGSLFGALGERVQSAISISKDVKTIKP